MRIFRSAVLAATLVVGAFVVHSCQSQVRMAEPVPVEYNLGSCGGRSFTVQHAVVKDKKLLFNYFMSDPKTVEKDPDQLAFDYEEQPKDKDGVVKFKAKAKYQDSALEINGAILNGRVVGIMTVDGDLGHVYYGEVGKVDDMVKVAEEDYMTCVAVHSIPQEEIPALLADFLLNKDKEKNVQ
jgi:hypothetical protein